MTDALAIEATDLTRTFVTGKGRARRTRTALDAVGLRVEQGSVHGLLGPNGAGKSTFAKILTTILLPTSGTATVLGHDVVREAAQVRRCVALVLGGDRGLYPRLSPAQNLEFWAAAYGMGRTRPTRDAVGAVLGQVGLGDVDYAVERFSRGMKQRLHLARALLVNPRILVLDEPTMGMDPAAAHAFRALVQDVNRRGVTVLMTTHDMREAEAVCDRVTLIDGGHIRFSDTPAELRSRARGEARVEVYDFAGRAPEDVAAEVARRPSVDAELRTDGVLSVAVRDGGSIGDLLQYLVAAGLHDFAVMRPTLEDVYLQAVGDRGMHVG
ncbi:ABC transporter ATP-binding protein [Cellulomonas sp. Leaf334]|uniref:ABC transporter ATP-binding protein n=1 Tax=Cellulomonas sp. Leaf334 TaxID=1736339 RepID=UPI0006F6CAFA|nr:ABC transporter ATP-binding protein [Cellulomonas sp. Leaf334]KQR11673.1 hypothetical protein ASF78_10535 [Cellulomonas sp. Leaf334]